MAKNCLIYETLNGVKEMKVKRSDEGLMTLSGVFGVCGVRNNNQRVYETSNYSKMVAEMQERIKNEGGIPGELEHPQLMNITLENVSHKITDINIDENGLVTGSITLLNTPKGQIAQAIVEGGLPLFISSRATGQVDKNSGNVTLERIATYDLVGSPGFSQAKLHLNENQVAESINESAIFYITEKEEEVVEEPIKTEEPKIEENENNNIDEMELKEILEKVEALESRIAELEDMNSDLQSQIDEKADFDLEKLANGIQKWIVEEYAPEVDNWVSTKITESINESKKNGLSAIDETLTLLENIEATKPTYSRKSLITENANEPKYIQDMPADVRVKYDLASADVKESIRRRATIYDFTCEGAIEKFWNSINFDNIKPAKSISEGLENIIDERERNIRASLRSWRNRK